jgi:hypothetical protein
MLTNYIINKKEGGIVTRAKSANVNVMQGK